MGRAPSLCSGTLMGMILSLDSTTLTTSSFKDLNGGSLFASLGDFNGGDFIVSLRNLNGGYREIEGV